MKTTPIRNLIMPSCRQWSKLSRSQWRPGHMTPPLGVKGQNVSYFQNFQNASPPTDYIAWSRDSCMLISLTPSTKVIPINWIWGRLGSEGSKVDFHQKCYKSSMLHRMTIRVIHVYKLETCYSCCGSQVNQGSLDVMGVKSLFWYPLL